MVLDLNVALGLEDGDESVGGTSRRVDEKEYNDMKSEYIDMKEEENIEYERTNKFVNVKIEKDDIPSAGEEENSFRSVLVSRLLKKKKMNENENKNENEGPKNENDKEQKGKEKISEEESELGIQFTCSYLEEHLSVGKVYPDLEKVYLLYCEYARFKGFSVRRGEQRYFGKCGEVRWKLFQCSCTGLPNYSSYKHKLGIYRKLVTRTDCKAKLIVSRECLGPFTVINFDLEHNHSLVHADQTFLLRSCRNLDYAKKSVLEALNSVGIGVSTACKFMEKESGGVQNLGFTRKDAYHHVELQRKVTKVEDGDAWMLVDYFSKKSNSEPFFFWKYQLDDDGRILNIFWRDTRCAVDYDCFGDVLSVDTTFRTNKYNLVAAPFVGINHHCNNVLFGMALMSDEKTASFMWLFETFLESMHGKQPKTIFSDQCRAMMNAIDATFPKSKHRLCQWHISKNCAQNFGALNGDKTFKALWHKCMNGVETVKDFDNTWEEMMKYKIKNRSWYDGMHNIRERWASIFSRGIFSAGLLATSRSESTNNALKKLVEAKISLIEFVRQYEEVQTTWRQKESEEDTWAIWLPGQIIRNNKLLRHAASVYTRTVYKSFEFSFTNSLNLDLDEYPVDLGDGILEYIARDKNEPSYKHTVTFKTATKSARCTCGLFETEGLICCHIIKVFDRKAVNAIPEDLIVPRWTKIAKHHLPNSDGNGTVVEDSSLMAYMVFAHETMRYMYEVVSAGFKQDEARLQILQRMKSLRVEFSEFVRPKEEPKKPPTPAGGVKIRNPKKVEKKAKPIVPKPPPKPRKRAPKPMAARSYQRKKPRKSQQAQETINFMKGSDHPFDDQYVEDKENWFKLSL